MLFNDGHPIKYMPRSIVSTAPHFLPSSIKLFYGTGLGSAPIRAQGPIWGTATGLRSLECAVWTGDSDWSEESHAVTAER